MPDYKSQQFYNEDYKTRDYGTLMNRYEKHHLIAEKVAKNAEWNKKKKVRVWTEADQLLEEMLWVS